MRYLCNQFGDRGIRGAESGLLAPLTSSPFDFCLWGPLKSKVDSLHPATLNQMQGNIPREVAQIDPAMMRRAMLNMRARVVKCIAEGDGLFAK